MLQTGIDIVAMSRFKDRVKDADALRRMFTEQELIYANGSVETLAGIFAAKEAYAKAARVIPEWQSIEVVHDASGAPRIHAPQEIRASMSISHDGDYAVAMVVIDK